MTLDHLVPSTLGELSSRLSELRGWRRAIRAELDRYLAAGIPPEGLTRARAELEETDRKLSGLERLKRFMRRGRA